MKSNLTLLFVVLVFPLFIKHLGVQELFAEQATVVYFPLVQKPPKNILPNPNFDVDLEGWTYNSLVSHQTANYFTAPGTAQLGPDTSTTEAPALLTDYISTSNNAVYLVVLWFKATSFDDDGKLLISTFQYLEIAQGQPPSPVPGEGVQRSFLKSEIVLNQWTPVYLQDTTHDQSSHLRIRVAYTRTSSNQSNAIIYMDDFFLGKVGPIP